MIDVVVFFRFGLVLSSSHAGSALGRASKVRSVLKKENPDLITK